MSFKSIPSVTSIRSLSDVQKILEALKYNQEVALGLRANGNETLDRVLTRSEAVDRGIAKLDSTKKNVDPFYKGWSYTAIPDRVRGLSIEGALSLIHLSWTAVDFPYVAYYEIWRSATNNIGTAVRIGTTSSTFYGDDVAKSADDAGKGQLYYYWVRAVSEANKNGPFNDTAGTVGMVSYDHEYALSLLTKRWEEGTYAVGEYVIPTPGNESGVWYVVQSITGTGATGATEPDWSTATTVGSTIVDNEVTWEAVAAGSLNKPFFIGEVGGTPAVIIDTAFIGDATITNAMIGNVSADKIITGTLAATISITGGLIRTAASGWRTEIDDTFPFWYGTGTKNTTNGRVYVDSSGNFVIKDANGNVAFSVNLGGYLNRTTGAIFEETFEHADTLTNWTNVAGSGELSIVSVSDSQAGGKILRVGDNSGNDQAWLIYDHHIPFDPTKLYKLTFRVRRTAGTGTVYVGWEGLAANGSTLVNISGVDTHSSQHYHCINEGNPASSWTEYVGYTKGYGASTGTGVAGTLSSPGQMHPDVRYIRPMILVNYSVVAGTTEVDAYIIEEISTGATDTDLPVFQTQTAIESIVSISDAGAIRNASWPTTKKISLDFASQLLAIGDDTWGSALAKLLFQYNSGSPRAYIGDGDSKFFSFDGTDVTIGRDTQLVGADAYNNDSIYWHTFFESIDGYDVTVPGGGSVTVDGSYLEVISSTDISISTITKTITYPIATWTYDSDRRFRTRATFVSSTFDSDQECYIATGSGATGFGFKTVGSTLYGTIAGASSVNLSTTVVSGTSYILEAIFTAGSKIEFYVNGVKKGEVTSGLPTGTTGAAYPLTIIASRGFFTGATVAVRLSEFIFLQE